MKTAREKVNPTYEDMGLFEEGPTYERTFYDTNIPSQSGIHIEIAYRFGSAYSSDKNAFEEMFPWMRMTSFTNDLQLMPYVLAMLSDKNWLAVESLPSKQKIPNHVFDFVRNLHREKL